MRGELDERERTNISAGSRGLSRGRSGDILTDNLVGAPRQRLFDKIWDWTRIYRRREKNIGVEPFQAGVQARIHPFSNGDRRRARSDRRSAQQTATPSVISDLREVRVAIAVTRNEDDDDRRENGPTPIERPADGGDARVLATPSG